MNEITKIENKIRQDINTSELIELFVFVHNKYYRLKEEKVKDDSINKWYCLLVDVANTTMYKLGGGIKLLNDTRINKGYKKENNYWIQKS